MTTSYFEQLPNELKIKILLSLDVDDLKNLCQANKNIKSVCQDPYFWKQKAELDFQFPQEYFEVKNISPLNRYVQIRDNYVKECFGDDDIILEKCIDNASLIGDIPLIELFYDRGAELDVAIYNLVKNNHDEVAFYLLDKYPEQIFQAVIYPLSLGDERVFYYLFNNYKDAFNQGDVNRLIAFSVRDENFEVVKFLILNGKVDISSAKSILSRSRLSSIRSLLR